MLQYDQAIAAIRLNLLYPDAFAPNDDFILQKLADSCQLLHLQLNNTATGWSQESMPLTLAPNTRDIDLIDVPPNFGKPVRLHTYDPNNPRLATSKIELIDRRDQEAYPGVDAAVYWIDSQTRQPKLEFLQQWPQQRFFKLWWETGEVGDPMLENVLPVTNPFHRYAVIKATVACVSGCEWAALGAGLAPSDAEKAFEARRKSLETRLMKQELEYSVTFDEYIWSNRESGTGTILGYAEDFEMISQQPEQWIWGGRG